MKYILYIEDEPTQAKLFSKIIEDEVKEFGYKVVVINNLDDVEKFLAGEKVTEVPRNDIGLILLDLSLLNLSLNDISGLQVLREIHNSKLQIPVAVLSATEDEEIAQEAKRLGAKDYFVKGKDEKELERLRSFIIAACSKN
jgi:CheY-like chemotaxis protein